MTLDLTARYPAQVISGDPAYPLGKARNRVTPGDGTGTPYEADLVNDLHGSIQATLDAAGITASGTPDAAGASDFVDSLDKLYIGHGCTVDFANSTPASDADFTITGINSTHTKTGYTYTLSSNQVTVPEAGLYLVNARLRMQNATGAGTTTVEALLRRGTSLVESLSAQRFGSDSNLVVDFAPSHTVLVTDPATHKIHIEAGAANMVVNVGSSMTICRIG